MAGRPAQAVGDALATEHEVDGRERDVHGCPGRDVRARDERRRGVEAPEPGPPADMDGLPRDCRDGGVGHPLEHGAVRVRVGAQERTIDPLPLELGPRDLEEPHQARVVDGGDRCFAVLGRRGEGEPAVGLERDSDQLGALGDLVGRDRQAHERLGRDVVREVGGRIDDVHRWRSPYASASPATDRIAALTASGR